MYDILKIDNDFNDFWTDAPLTKTENDILAVTLSKFHEKLNQQFSADDPDTHYMIRLTNDDLIEQLHMPKSVRRPSYIYSLMVSMYEKLKSFNSFEKQTGDEKRHNRVYAKIDLFSSFVANESKKEYQIYINPQLAYLVRNPQYYTSLSVVQICSLKKPYAQILYRKLKQWKRTGQFYIDDLDHLRNILGVPDSYTDSFLTNRVIGPAVNELRTTLDCFKDLDVKVIKQGKNHKLVGYQFTWTKAEGKEIAPEPLLADVKAYFREKRFRSSADVFFHYYAKEGWKDSKGQAIRNWKIAANLWEARQKKFDEDKKKSSSWRASHPENTVFNSFKQRTYDYSVLEAILRKNT